jgi:SAM-dependent methyltransferase
MCADIDYQAQSTYVRRLHQLFGNDGQRYLDLACGTGPHLRHFIHCGYFASGVDLHQPMLDIAKQRCPEAQFMQQDMSELSVAEPFDLISCFLYSIHYNQSLEKLAACIARVHAALNPGGLFCFNAVDKNTIDNRLGIKHYLDHDNSHFSFQSSWFYEGQGERQTLQLCIERTTGEKIESWRDQHPMVAFGFQELQAMLEPYFSVYIFEHDYQKIMPWGGSAGNAFFVGVKI